MQLELNEVVFLTYTRVCLIQGRRQWCRTGLCVRISSLHLAGVIVFPENATRRAYVRYLRYASQHGKSFLCFRAYPSSYNVQYI